MLKNELISIFEKQLMDSLELQWHVQRARLYLKGNSTRIQSLFEGLSCELGFFVEGIRNHLCLLRMEDTELVMSSSSYWHLLAADSLDDRDHIEALLYGYAHYAKQTSDAIAHLERFDDPEGVELLDQVFKTTDRCLWFLEMYLEGVALMTDESRLPEWPLSENRSAALL